MRVFLLSAIVAVLSSACGMPAPRFDGGLATVDAGAPDAGAPDAGASDGGGPFSCEVRSLLERHCWPCHGLMLDQGAPQHLLTRADLLAPSPFAPMLTNGERALARMSLTVGRMPPEPNAAVPMADVEVFRMAKLVNFIGAACPDAGP